MRGAGVLGAGTAHALPLALDLRRYAFVRLEASPTIVLVDLEAGSVAGRLSLGRIVRSFVVSRDLACLAATDGVTPELAVLDVTTGHARRIGLPGPAQRLVLGASGWLVAAFDAMAGRVSIIDLLKDRVAGSVEGVPGLRDMMFADDDRLLLLAETGAPGLQVVASDRVLRAAPVALPLPPGSGVVQLARMPNGRRALALPESGGAVLAFDLREPRDVARLDASARPRGIYPSGTGTAIFAPDEAGDLLVLRDAMPRQPVVLPGAPGILAVYASWLDSVAFAPSVSLRALLVYDLDRPALVQRLDLPGTPGPGGVTADSRVLCLPVAEAGQVVLVDGETRRITARLDLGGVPRAALVPGGWAVCH